MSAQAIWWRMDSNVLVLRARDDWGTCLLRSNYRFGDDEIVVLEYASVDGKRAYDLDNANPRRQGANTVTLSEAKKLSREMIAVARDRISEATTYYEYDPGLYLVRYEIENAHTVECVKVLRAAIAAEPDDADPQGLIASAARHLGKIESANGDAVGNPWAWAKTTRMFNPRGDEGFQIDTERKRSTARVRFVLGLSLTPEQRLYVQKETA